MNKILLNHFQAGAATRELFVCAFCYSAATGRQHFTKQSYKVCRLVGGHFAIVENEKPFIDVGTENAKLYADNQTFE